MKNKSVRRHRHESWHLDLGRDKIQVQQQIEIAGTAATEAKGLCKNRCE